MTISAPPSLDSKSQLPKTMGFWDVLLFNIATVLGPRWIAAAGHNGVPLRSACGFWPQSSFFVPGVLVINELSSRFPEEGGLYVWAREAFGDFHEFVAGWSYWIYTVFYFPGLLLASEAMSAYIVAGREAALSQDRTFLLTVSLAMLLVAVLPNIIGLNIGKWLQNATQPSPRIGFGLGVTRHHQPAAVRGGQAYIEHLDRSQFVQYCLGCQSRRKACRRFFSVTTRQ